MVNDKQEERSSRLREHLETWMIGILLGGTLVGGIMASVIRGASVLDFLVPTMLSLFTFLFLVTRFRPLPWWGIAALFVVNAAWACTSEVYGAPRGFLQFLAWALLQGLALGAWKSWRGAANSAAGPSAAGAVTWYERAGLSEILVDHPVSRRLLAVTVSVTLASAGLAVANPTFRGEWLTPVAMAFSFAVVTTIFLAPLRWPQAAVALCLNGGAAVTAGVLGWPSGFWQCLLWFLAQLAMLFLWAAFDQGYLPPGREAARPRRGSRLSYRLTRRHARGGSGN